MHHYGRTEKLKMDMLRFLRQLPKFLFLRELEKLKSIAKLWFGSPESILHHSVFHFVCSCLLLYFNIMLKYLWNIPNTISIYLKLRIFIAPSETSDRLRGPVHISYTSTLGCYSNLAFLTVT